MPPSAGIRTIQETLAQITMNLELFNKSFNSKQLLHQNVNGLETSNSELNSILANFGGYSFDNGLFRIHNFHTSQKWTQIICETYPKYQNRISAYGFDWLGRQFATDLNKDCTYMFDIATGEDYKLEQSLSDFFNIELIEYADETLNIAGFQNWNTEKIELSFDQVVAYKIPLLLGGKDSPENYEIADAEVNWEINSQLKSK
tara:strand:+ start:3198 stop:3803 length:606 start_codon:yes stop_codon:yes gene_type:complete